MRTIRRCLDAMVLLLAGPAVFAAPLFSDDAAIVVEFEGPLGQLMRQMEEPTELPFVFRADGIEYGVAVRLRGKSRQRVCKLKPLRLNFRKSETRDTLLDGQNKLKLVVPCGWSARAEKDLLEEYLAYRIFNLLTPVSYRVRLLRITFVDTNDASNDATKQRHAFVIEPPEQVAARIGGRQAKLSGVTLSMLDPEHSALVYVFHYLVANTDWSLVSPTDKTECCHNGTLIERENYILYVPYDFDLAGLVNTPYAKPAPDLKLRKVTQRRYRGFCTEREILTGAIRQVGSQRDEVSELIRALPVLTDKDKKRRKTYLGRFFKDAEDPDKLSERLEYWCIE
jgi:hypothetical protein